jgi:hypothetical protein
MYIADVAFYDIARGIFLDAPIPLGTAPVPRAYATLTLLNQDALVLMGGVGPTGTMLFIQVTCNNLVSRLAGYIGDVWRLNFSQPGSIPSTCPPVDLSAVAAYRSYQSGTVLYIDQCVNGAIRQVQ